MPTLTGLLLGFYGDSSAIYNDVLQAVLFFALFMYAYALGSYCPWRRSLLGLLPMTAGLLVAMGGG